MYLVPVVVVLVVIVLAVLMALTAPLWARALKGLANLFTNQLNEAGEVLDPDSKEK